MDTKHICPHYTWAVLNLSASYFWQSAILLDLVSLPYLTLPSEQDSDTLYTSSTGHGFV